VIDDEPLGIDDAGRGRRRQEHNAKSQRRAERPGNSTQRHRQRIPRANRTCGLRLADGGKSPERDNLDAPHARQPP
jgi:hypothetical protein